jgi:hypothetical protein
VNGWPERRTTHFYKPAGRRSRATRPKPQDAGSFYIMR